MVDKLKPFSSTTTANAVVKIEHGPNAMALEDDKAFIVAPGSWKADINRRGYSAGYLTLNEGPLLSALGTAGPASKLFPTEANRGNAALSAVERFDAAFQAATGQPGSLTERYRREGYKSDARGWEGFCERWSIMSLDPVIGPKLNEPRVYKGEYFSIADQRGLATFFGDQHVSYQDLFIASPKVIDLHKAAFAFIHDGGPGFIADRFNNDANRMANLHRTGINASWANQTWNQPFYAVEQHITDANTSDLAEGMAKLGLNELEPGQKIYRVKSKFTYGAEAQPEDAPGGRDHYEGPGKETPLNLDYFLLVGESGQVLDGQLANGSDPLPDSLWVPNRTQEWKSKEGAFLQELVERGVNLAKVQAFEDAMTRLTAVGKPVTAEHKALLRTEFKGVSEAYAPGKLDGALKVLGLSGADFE